MNSGVVLRRMRDCIATGWLTDPAAYVRLKRESQCPTGGIHIGYASCMRTNVTRHVTTGKAAIIPGVSFLIQSALFEPGVVPGDVALADAQAARMPVRKRDTKTKGDVSELRVALALAEAGYLVSKPLGENQRYDLIADDGARLHRVQVKTGRVRGGVVVFSCASSHAHRARATRPYFGEVEYLAVYSPETKKVYMIPEKEMTASTAHLRLSPTRNNMAKTIRWASRFELA